MSDHYANLMFALITAIFVLLVVRDFQRPTHLQNLAPLQDGGMGSDDEPAQVKFFERNLALESTSLGSDD